MTNEFKIRPLYDRVIVEVKKREVLDNQAYLPEQDTNADSLKGRVVAIGEGKLGDDNTFLTMPFKIGDVIIFMNNRFTEITVEGRKYLIVPEGVILGIEN